VRCNYEKYLLINALKPFFSAIVMSEFSARPEEFDETKRSVVIADNEIFKKKRDLCIGL